MNKKVEADGYTYDYYLESQPILWSNPNFTGPLWYSQQYFYIYYTPAAAQPIKVEYVTNSGQVLGTDQTTGKTLQTVTVTTVTGAYGTTSQYQPTNLINYYESLGYVVVSDNYPASGVTFNQNGTVQKFTIVLKHGTTTYTPSNNPQNLDLTNTVTQTINYIYSNGQQAAPSKVTKLTFTRTATRDDVTGAITYSNWTPASGTFPAVTSPTITGYTPSQATSTVVNDVTGNSSNNVQVITYTPDQESATVEYLDQTTGKVLSTVHLTGDYNSTSSYRTASAIQQYEALGYQLVSNNYPTNGVKFNQNVQTFQVVLKEGTTTYTPSNNPKQLTLTNTVTQTITYVYSTGGTAAPTKTTTITLYS